MNIILFDPTYRKKFFPLNVNKAVAELQTGMFTLLDWWGKITNEKCFVLTPKYLSGKYEICKNLNDECIYINASTIPSNALWQKISALKTETKLLNNAQIFIAFKSKKNLSWEEISELEIQEKNYFDAEIISETFHLFQKNKSFIEAQFPLATRNKTSADISSSNILIGKENIFVEENCSIEGVILNATDGPIYISKNSIVMEGSCVKGAFFLGENSVVKMGAKIYGATSIGKKCTIGGEIKNIVMHDFSNKAHDGYLGDSVIGSWCNLGAGTSCSNVKNTANNVKIFSYELNKMIDAGLKCGTIMGDYSRTAINSAINSGTSIGICCNVITESLSEKYYPYFSWKKNLAGSYDFEKALAHISNWMHFKNEKLNDAETNVLKELYENI